VNGYILNVLTFTIYSAAAAKPKIRMGSECESDETETEVLAALALRGRNRRSYADEELCPRLNMYSSTVSSRVVAYMHLN
jgi:hypothetical protein